MQYCNRCVYPSNHPLGITFDDDGVCSGCRVHEEKYKIDWSKKRKELKKLLTPYKNNNNNYDCIIPVVGSGDDYFVTDLIKNEFGMNPLLVSYNSHFNTKIGIRNLSRLITKLDCDHLLNTVGPDTVKIISRITLEKIGSIYWHVLAGTQTFPVQVALKFNIPLIIWGVYGWLDQVGMFSHYDQVEMTKRVREEHSLKTFDTEMLVGENSKLSKKDLQAFTYPSIEEIKRNKIRGIYVGNYVFWDSQQQTEKMIKKYGYETAGQQRTFNKYETIHCAVNSGVHDYVKYLKYGYGKCTDHASRDIRLGRLSRKKAINLIKQYDSLKPDNTKIFLEWLGVSENKFYRNINNFRDPKIWKSNKPNLWRIKDAINNKNIDTKIKSVSIKNIKTKPYLKTKLLEPHNNKEKYVLTGRSYMDKFNFTAMGN